MIDSWPVGRPETAGWHLSIIDTPEELAEVEALQRIVWPGDDLEIVPPHVLLTAAHNGGLVAGVWAGARLAGFVFGFLGFHDAESARRLKHCSHMLGVHPDFRGAGVAYALKTCQREHVLRQGLDLITWTYDPLLARNAQLNIARLGAVCTTYLPNLYGSMRDGLNAGLPSDRFQVDWWIATERVADRLSRARNDRAGRAELLMAGAVWLNPSGPDGAPRPPNLSSPAIEASTTVLVEIPADFPALKAADPALALRWRMSTRAAFQALFQQGYAVTDFIREPGNSPRAAYVLTQTQFIKEPTA
jgi:predicted GNAT superfamily acetyltransferase